MSSESARLITLSSEELREVKKVASDDALFKSTVLVEMRTMHKKVDLINGTVRTHGGKLDGNKVAHTFYNLLIAGGIAVYGIIIRFMFVLYGKIEVLASGMKSLQ